MDNQQVYSMPRIGDKAPDFMTTTTTGPLKLSEYNKDIWIIFFSAFSAVTLFKFNRDRETDEKFKVADQLSQKNDSLLMQTMDDVILQMKNNSCCLFYCGS